LLDGTRVRSQPLEKVVIIAGGSAGCLTAALVAAAHQSQRNASQYWRDHRTPESITECQRGSQ
jgi:patatin-like phospholipase/acyl hydrolase